MGVAATGVKYLNIGEPEPEEPWSLSCNMDIMQHCSMLQSCWQKHRLSELPVDHTLPLPLTSSRYPSLIAHQRQSTEAAFLVSYQKKAVGKECRRSTPHSFLAHWNSKAASQVALRRRNSRPVVRCQRVRALTTHNVLLRVQSLNLSSTPDRACK